MSNNTTRKVTPARRIAPTTGATTMPKDYAETVATVKKQGAAFKSAARAAGKSADKAAVIGIRTTVLALDKGFLWAGKPGEGPEHSVSRATFGRDYFGLANGSLVTFWVAMADAVSKGVTYDSDLFKVLALGTSPAGRRGGMAEAIGKATDVAGIEKACRTVAKVDPKTGAKIVGGPKGPKGVKDGAKPSDPVTVATEAVQALRAALPKVKDDASYLKIRAALALLLDSQDKGRKVGPHAPKPTAPKGAATTASTEKAA